MILEHTYEKSKEDNLLNKRGKFIVAIMRKR